MKLPIGLFADEVWDVLDIISGILDQALNTNVPLLGAMCHMPVAKDSPKAPTAVSREPCSSQPRKRARPRPR